MVDRRTWRAKNQNIDVLRKIDSRTYLVNGTRGKDYEVNLDTPSCTCPDWKKREPDGGCKHIRAVYLEGETGETSTSRNSRGRRNSEKKVGGDTGSSSDPVGTPTSRSQSQKKPKNNSKSTLGNRPKRDTSKPGFSTSSETDVEDDLDSEQEESAIWAFTAIIILSSAVWLTFEMVLYYREIELLTMLSRFLVTIVSITLLQILYIMSVDTDDAGYILTLYMMAIGLITAILDPNETLIEIE